MTIPNRLSQENSKKSTVVKVALSVLMVLAFTHPAFSQEFDQELMKKATVVFIGTVTKLDAVSFADVAPSGRTAVLRVDQILEKPGAIALHDGMDVTVRLNDPKLLPEDTQAIIYADGWIVGAGVALIEVGHSKLTMDGTAAAREHMSVKFRDAQRNLYDNELRSRIDSAAIVALGRVKAVRPAQQEKAFVTEHDPEWQEAILVVQTPVKGTSAGEEIVVRFPGSMDVTFYRSPKLKEGDQRIVLGVPDTRSGLPKAMLAGKQTEAYIIRDRSDLLVKEDLERVQRVMKFR